MAQNKEMANENNLLTVQHNRRVLYFSDGTMEEETSDSEIDADVPDSSMDIQIDEKMLPFVPRLKYKAHKMGTNILAGIDYIGGGLASFLGITTPKYASETDYYKSTKQYNDSGAEQENNWQPNAGRAQNNNNNHRLEEVVTTPPVSVEMALPSSRQ